MKGADSLELERGQHQFLFRVEQPADPRKTALPGYQSVPMIVAFTAAAKTITIRLPPLTSARERHNFDRTLAFRLVDEKGKEIFSVRDRLPTSPGVDIEKKPWLSIIAWAWRPLCRNSRILPRPLLPPN